MWRLICVLIFLSSPAAFAQDRSLKFEIIVPAGMLAQTDKPTCADWGGKDPSASCEFVCVHFPDKSQIGQISVEASDVGAAYGTRAKGRDFGWALFQRTPVAPMFGGGTRTCFVFQNWKSNLSRQFAATIAYQAEQGEASLEIPLSVNDISVQDALAHTRSLGSQTSEVDESWRRLAFAKLHLFVQQQIKNKYGFMTTLDDRHVVEPQAVGELGEIDKIAPELFAILQSSLANSSILASPEYRERQALIPHLVLQMLLELSGVAYPIPSAIEEELKQIAKVPVDKNPAQMFAAQILIRSGAPGSGVVLKDYFLRNVFDPRDEARQDFAYYGHRLPKEDQDWLSWIP